MKTAKAIPIAVIGMACRFPGAVQDPQAFWSMMQSKTDCIGPIPHDRWDPSLLDNLNLSAEAQFAKAGGFLDSVYDFDHERFDISSREAAQIDPQQRILLEMAWQCMEDAALSPPRLEQAATGVYLGVISHDFERLSLADRVAINAYSGLGRSSSITANRISYSFNLSGPSIAIDTACSSSLAAIDAACSALANGSADLAFAGGVNAILAPESYIEFSKAAMLSKIGRCQTFDAKADGFVRAEGGGLVLLKRLSDALVDADRIHATIIATRVNQDGKTAGIMAPDCEAQQAMMRDALGVCGLERFDVGFVEAHGTGTQVGDTIEARSVGTVYGHPNLYVGSVKSNIGHTEGAAGIAGLVKAILAVRHGVIPPNLHFSTPNPGIDFESLGIRVPTESVTWNTPNGKPRVAAVNSFGFGGTNAHVIVRQAPTTPAHPTRKSHPDWLVPVSAPTPKSLDKLLESVSNTIAEATTPVADFAFTANRLAGSAFRTALKVPAGDVSKFKNSKNAKSSWRTATTKLSANNHHVAFVFNGIGQNWDGQGAQLYSTEPQFRAAVERCDAVFGSALGIRDSFRTGTPFAAHCLTKAHAIHFTLQIALDALWKSWAVRPDAVIGHSMGEVAAACSAGFLTLPQAARLVVERASRIEPYCNQGLMLAVAMTPKGARKLIAKHQFTIVLAAINSKDSVTLAGPTGEIQTLARLLDHQNTFNRLLEVPVPFHSPIIDGAKANAPVITLTDQNDKLRNAKWFSSVTGCRIHREYKAPEFWWDNFLGLVNFRQALEHAIEAGVRLIVEIGPHANLHYNIHECFGHLDLAEASRTVYSLHKDRVETTTMKSAAGDLYAHGVNLAFDQINGTGEVCQFPSLVFSRRKFRPAWAAPGTPGNVAHLPLLETQSKTKQSWKIPLNPQQWSWLGHHQLDGKVIFPAAGYVEVALQAATLCFGASNVRLHALEIPKLLSLDDCNENGLEISTQPNLESWQFEVARLATGSSKRTTHCHGRIAEGSKSRPMLQMDELQSRFRTSLSPNLIDEQFERLNFSGDTSRWKICEVRTHDQSEVLVQLKKVNQATHEDERWRLDPTVLDLCFRSVIAITNNQELLVPYSIASLDYWPDDTQEIFCHIRSHTEDSDVLEFDLDIANPAGALIARISKFHIRQLRQPKSQPLENRTPLVVQKRQWKLASRTPTAEAAFDWDPATLEQKVSEYFLNLVNSEQRWRHYESIDSALTDIAVAYIGQALRQAQLCSDYEQTTVGRFHSQCKIDDSQTVLFHALLELLSKCGHIELTDPPDRLTSDTDIHWIKAPDSNPDQSISNFLSLPDACEYATELLLISQCGTQLKDILTGEVSGLDVLFPEDGATHHLQNFYFSAPTCRIYNRALCHSVALLLNSWTLARPCRILEVGAGSGALLTHLMPVLEKHSVDYTFTDVSSLFVRRAKTRFGQLNHVQFKRFDLNADPRQQGFDPGTYDIVLAGDALHLAVHPKQALKNLAELLQPNGYLGFIELTHEPNWARLVFGLLRDWWPKDTTDRSSLSPCLARSKWRHLIEQSGCELIAELTDQTADTDGVHTVFLSRKFEPKTNLPSSFEKAACKRLVLSDRSDFSVQLIDLFHDESVVSISAGIKYSADERAFVIDPEQPQHFVQFIESLRQQDAIPEEIVFLWNFVRPESTQLDMEARLKSSSVLSLARLVQAFDHHGMMPNQFTLVTSNVYKNAHPTQFPNFLDAGLWGFGKTLRNEFPGLKLRLIDIDPLENLAAMELYQFLQTDDHFDDICLRMAMPYLPVDVPVDPDRLQVKPPQFSVLALQQRGDLDSLGYTVQTLPALGATEVVIEVAASALNFRDVMVALDALPDAAIHSGYMRQSLGIECAGTIVQVGREVQSLAPGDRVVALAKHSLASHTIADQRFVQTIAKDQRMASYAVLPVAYVTALICLQETIQLKASDRVLIHCGSGGVGLALIHLAKKCGCTVYATAGAPDKVNLLKRFGIERVATSRSTAFVDDILKWTGGARVDVIVNMLAGDLAAANKEILASDGTMIELGKYEDRVKIHAEIQTTLPDANLMTVDIDSLWLKDPDLISKLFRASIKRVTDGDLPPLVYQEFPAANVREAFRHMASAAHIGKILLTSDGSLTHGRLQQQSIIQNFGAYVVSGGTRGFGLATAKWLVQQGAKHVVVIGRNRKVAKGLTDYCQEASTLGCEIHVLAADICDRQAFHLALTAVLENLPPLRGVFHCAMNIKDSTIINLNDEGFNQSTRAKVIGAWNLHQATKHLSLDFFVLYSSVTSVLGPAGQAAYAAANAMLDALANDLQQLGVPAIAINWGAISDVGHVADHPDISTAVGEQFGIVALPARQMLVALNGLIGCANISQVTIAGKSEPSDHASISSNATDQHHFNQAPKSDDQVKPNVNGTLDSVLNCVSRVLDIPTHAIDVEDPIVNLGIDSLLAVELSHLLRADCGIEISAASILDSITIDKMLKDSQATT